MNFRRACRVWMTKRVMRIVPHARKLSCVVQRPQCPQAELAALGVALAPVLAALEAQAG